MATRLSILIADDKEINRMILKGIFGGDFRIYEAKDGEEALEILHTTKIDIVLLDVRMPKLDGIEVLKRIRQDEKLKNIAVIANTEYLGSDYEVTMLELGANDFISKPYDTRAVKKRINNVCRYIAMEKQNRIAFQGELEYRARFDMLTGLLNRESFCEETRLFLDKTEELCVICVWNVDRFKVVNELFGSKKGDCVLQNLAGILEEHIKDRGVCARAEADQFMFCITEKYLQEGLEEIEDILYGRTANWAPIDFTLLLHMGVYRVVEKHVPVEQMIDRAALALDRIKDSYINRVSYYDPELKNAILTEQEMTNEMEVALNEHQFYIVLQPIVDTKTGKTISAEALIRWEHPVKGVIRPGLFLPLFEKNGFIAVLDLYVCEEVCKFQAKRMKEKQEVVPISVNISRVNFYRKDFCKQLCCLLEKYGVTPELIKLEITEGAYEDNPKYMMEAIEQFKKSSFKILMDDFGSGYSSLNMLKDFHVDILKIDMQFINDIEKSDRANIILYIIIQMAKALNMETVAEGVETKQQYELLASMGCDTIQGYYFSPPVKADEFESRLENEANMVFTEHQLQTKPTILIVDDQKTERALLRKMIGDEYHVLEAADGEEALKILELQFSHIDLMLLDMHMPKMDGLGLMKRMKEKMYLADVPVLMITADGDRENAEKALNAGALDLITKPYDAVLVHHRIRNILRLSETNRLLEQVQRVILS